MEALLMLLVTVITISAGDQNATDQQEQQAAGLCSQQIESWRLCQMMELPRSPEGRMMKEKIDKVYEKCAGTMPKNCTVFWRTADDCFHQELDRAENDPQNNSTKREALRTIDQCYQRAPNDPFADLFEELYPEMLLFDDGGMKAQQQQQLTFGGRRFLPPPQCAPTLENLHCVSKEMTAMAQDPEAKSASETLRMLKRSCDDKLPPQCTPQSPPLWMCLNRAMKELTRSVESSMQKCMQQKGFILLLRSATSRPGAVASFNSAGWAGQQGMPFNSGGPAAGGFPWAGNPQPPFAAQSGLGGFQGQPGMFDWPHE